MSQPAANFMLRDMCSTSGNYGADKVIVYYEELWYSVEDLETKMLLNLKIIRRGRITPIQLLVDKGPRAVKGVCVCVCVCVCTFKCTEFVCTSCFSCVGTSDVFGGGKP